MNWSAKQYSAFENERTRPVRDRSPPCPMSAWRGRWTWAAARNSTEVLAARYPDAAISGTDNSHMIDAARKRRPACPSSCRTSPPGIRREATT